MDRRLTAGCSSCWVTDLMVGFGRECDFTANGVWDCGVSHGPLRRVGNTAQRGRRRKGRIWSMHGVPYLLRTKSRCPVLVLSDVIFIADNIQNTSAMRIQVTESYSTQCCCGNDVSFRKNGLVQKEVSGVCFEFIKLLRSSSFPR